MYELPPMSKTYKDQRHHRRKVAGILAGFIERAKRDRRRAGDPKRKEIH